MIKINMQMPEKCGLCPCFHFENPMYCQAVKADKNKKIVNPYGLPRPEWCPLKDDEAYILTINQLEDALDTVVWLETPTSENLADGYSLIMAYSHKYGYMLFDSPFGDSPSQDRLEYSEYGKSWRCWDRRPSEEKRKAMKWNEKL